VALQALGAHPMDTGPMVLLARLHLKRGELDACEAQCEVLLRVCERHRLAAEADADDGGQSGDAPNGMITGGGFDPGFGVAGGAAALRSGPREEGKLMLADVKFAQKDVAGATAHLKDILRGAPNNYDALARQLQLLWRAGTLEEEGPVLLKRAEKTSARAFADPGLCYCKGLFHRHAHDPHQALHHLNKARRDGEWGPAALSLMVTIYVEPFLGEVFDALRAGGSGDDDDDGPDRSKKKEGGAEQTAVLDRKRAIGARTTEVGGGQRMGHGVFDT